MEFETPRNSVEIAPELQFITFEAIDDIRQQQEDSVQAAEMQVAQDAVASGKFASSKSLKEARQSAEASFSEPFEAFLSSHVDATESPEHYAVLAALLQSFSIDHMGSTKWRNGDLDADGNYDFTTSGRYQLQVALETLTSRSSENDQPTDPSEEDPIDHMSPEAEAVYTALLSARTALAPLSLARRQLIRKGGKKAKALEAEYGQAKAAYDTALQNVTTFYVTGYRANCANDVTIREKVLPRLIDEHRAFTQTEFDLLKTDDSRRARIARFLGKKGAVFGLSAVSGVGIGLAARAVSKSALMAGIGITGGAVAGGAIAARLTKNILLAKVRNNIAINRDFEKRRDQDVSALKDHLTSTGEMPLDESVQSVHGKIGAIITDRVEKDRKSNRNRVAISALIGGAAAAAAFEFGPDLHHAFGGGYHDHDDVGAGSGTTTPDTPETPITPVTPVIPSAPIDNYGFNPHVTVEAGHGYIKEIQDLAAQKGDHLTIAQATDAYHHVLNSQGVHFFTDDQNYTFHGDNRIAHPGSATWDHAHLASLHQWLVENEKTAA